MLEMENKKDNNSEERKEIERVINNGWTTDNLIKELKKLKAMEVMVDDLDSQTEPVVALDDEDCALIDLVVGKLEDHKMLVDSYSELEELKNYFSGKLSDSLKSKDDLKVTIESLKEENRQLKENTKKLTHEKNKVEYENRRIKNRLSNYVSEDELAKMNEDEFYLQPANDKSEEIKEIESLIEIVNGNRKHMVGNAAESIYVSYEIIESILEKLVDYKNLFYAHSDLREENRQSAAESLELKKEIEDLKFKLIIKSTNINERDEELADENAELKKENFALKKLSAFNCGLSDKKEQLEKENEQLKKDNLELLSKLASQNDENMKMPVIESEELTYLQNKNRELKQNFELLKRLIYTFDKDVK